MAPVPSATGDVRLAHTGVFTVAGAAVTFAFDAGSDSDRFMVISATWHGGSAHALADGAVTFNGVAASPLGATVNASNCRKRTYVLTAPATGSHTVSVDPAAGFGTDAPVIIEVYCYSGVDQTTPSDGYASATGASADGALNITSAVGDVAWVSMSGQTNGATGGTASNFTRRLNTGIDQDSADVCAVSGDADGAASISAGVTFNTAVNWVAMGLNLNAAAGGGTGTTVEPGAGALTATGQAPVVLTPRVMRPAAGAVSATGYAPTVLTPRTIAAGVGVVTVTGFAPTVLSGTTVSPAAGTVSVTGYAPTLVTPQSVAPGTGVVSATGFAPAVLTPRVVSPAAGGVSATGYAPTVALPRAVRPATGAVALTGFAPTIVAGGLALVRPSAASLLFAGHAPLIVIDDGITPGKYAAQHARAAAMLARVPDLTKRHAAALRRLGAA